MNPHGFPSRMTVGKMIELVAGKAGVFEGRQGENDSNDWEFHDCCTVSKLAAMIMLLTLTLRVHRINVHTIYCTHASVGSNFFIMDKILRHDSMRIYFSYSQVYLTWSPLVDNTCTDSISHIFLYFRYMIIGYGSAFGEKYGNADRVEVACAALVRHGYSYVGKVRKQCHEVFPSVR